MFNNSKSRSVAKVLLGTIDVLNKRGWKRGAGWNWSFSGPVCVEGAMLQVLKIQDRNVLYAHPAYKVLRKHLGLERQHVWEWNDRSSKREVIRVLELVAGVEDTAAGHYELIQNFLAYKKRLELEKALANTLTKSDHVLVA